MTRAVGLGRAVRGRVVVAGPMQAPRQSVRGADRRRRGVGGLGEAETLRRVAMIAFEQRQIEVDRHAGRLEERDLGTGQVVLASAATASPVASWTSPSAMTYSGSGRTAAARSNPAAAPAEVTGA